MLCSYSNLGDIFWRRYMIRNKLKHSMLNIMSSQTVEKCLRQIIFFFVLFICNNKITLKTKTASFVKQLEFACFYFYRWITDTLYKIYIYSLHMLPPKKGKTLENKNEWYKFAYSDCCAWCSHWMIYTVTFAMINDGFSFRWKSIRIW